MYHGCNDDSPICPNIPNPSDCYRDQMCDPCDRHMDQMFDPSNSHRDQVYMCAWILCDHIPVTWCQHVHFGQVRHQMSWNDHYRFNCELDTFAYIFNSVEGGV